MAIWRERVVEGEKRGVQTFNLKSQAYHVISTGGDRQYISLL